MNTKAILTPEEQENYLYNTHRQQVSIVSEKEVETELYALLLQYHQRRLKIGYEVGVVSYTNPHHIDGLLTISTTESTHRLLIEAKTHSSLTTTGIWAPLAQALQYTHLLSHLGELLPGIIFIATEREWHAVQVDTLAPLLSRDDLPWESVPSARSPEMEATLQELNPSITSHVLDSSVDLNEALGSITSLLMESRHYSTKQHGGNLAQSSITIEVNPTTHLYHAPSKQWWRYQGENGAWSPIEQRDLTMGLREQAIRDGVPSRGVGALVRATIEEGQITCAAEKWSSAPGLINTPLGTWNTATGEMSPSIPQHSHRYSTGVLQQLPVETGEYSTHAMLLSRALKAISNYSCDNLILGVIPDSVNPSDILFVYAEALGSYARTGTHQDILSQWRWNPMAGDSPILLMELDVIERNKVIQQVSTFMAEEKRFKNTCTLMLVRESYYATLSPGSLDRVKIVADLTHKESLSKLNSPLLLSESLCLVGERVDIPTYQMPGGDNIRLWMEECLERDVNSAALNEDLRDSYNNWLEEHGYAPISHKVFLNRLEEHPLYIQWGLKLAKASRVGKLELSQWIDPTKKERAGYTPRHIGGGAASHVKFIRFAR